jgi:PHD/YefM family antitoxin component YafN of YafNO toxin-antitoxin module
VDKKARKKAVLLSLAQWRRVQEALEELDDIRAYDKVKSRREPAFPFEDAVRRIKGRRRK